MKPGRNVKRRHVYSLVEDKIDENFKSSDDYSNVNSLGDSQYVNINSKRLTDKDLWITKELIRWTKGFDPDDEYFTERIAKRNKRSERLQQILTVKLPIFVDQVSGIWHRVNKKKQM